MLDLELMVKGSLFVQETSAVVGMGSYLRPAVEKSDHRWYKDAVVVEEAAVE